MADTKKVDKDLQSEQNGVSRHLCTGPYVLPTSCTPPHDDYDYDCDVNRGPTLNHALMGVSLLPPMAFDYVGRVCSSSFSDGDRTRQEVIRDDRIEGQSESRLLF